MQVGLGPRRYAPLADRDRLGHHIPRLILTQPARLHRVRHRPRPLLRRAGRRAGAGLRAGDLAPDLILRLHIGALLRLPPAQEQLWLHRPGVGAVEGDEAGEPLDAPELSRVRGAAVLAGELLPDHPGHPQHCFGRYALPGRVPAGLPGRLGDRAGDGGQFAHVLVPRRLFPFGQLGADVQRRFGFAGPGAVGDVFLDPVHLPGIGPPPGLGFPLGGHLAGLGGDRLPAGGERVHQGLADPGDLPAVPVRPRHPRHPEVPGQRGLGHRGGDGGGSALEPVQRPGVQLAPPPVPLGDHLVEDQVVHVQLGVPVAGGVLPERPDHPVPGVLPLAQLGP